MIQMLVGAAALSNGTAEGFHVLGMPMITVRRKKKRKEEKKEKKKKNFVCFFFVVFLANPCFFCSSFLFSFFFFGQTTFSYRLVSFTVMGYLIGGPYMWMNMYGQRKRKKNLFFLLF